MKSTNFVISSVHGLSVIDSTAYFIYTKRCVPVEGTIDSGNVDWIMTQCELLIHQDELSPITFLFNSMGGSLDATYRLIDYIQGSETPFIGIASQMCASAAAQIFASLPKGQRLIMPHAHILIHQPLTSSGTYINSSNIKNMAYFLKSIENMVYQDLANWTGQLLSQITKDCAKETWLQGQEAIDYGLADHLYSRKTLKELEKSVNE